MDTYDVKADTNQKKQRKEWESPKHNIESKMSTMTSNHTSNVSKIYEMREGDNFRSSSPAVGGPRNYVTSLSSITSSSIASDGRMTSSHDNDQSTDLSLSDVSLKVYPLISNHARMSGLGFGGKSSEDEEVCSKKLRHLRLRKKLSPRRQRDIERESMTSPYPSSVSLNENSENEEVESIKFLFGNDLELQNGKVSSVLLSPQDHDVIMPLPINRIYYVDRQHLGFSSDIPEKYKQRFNASGKIFEIDSRNLDCHPETLLGNPAKRMRYFDWKRNEYFFDRHRNTFEIVLDFYVNGGVIRRPDNIPIDTFMKELKFYSFGRDTLEQFLRDEGILCVPKEKPMPDGKVKKFIWQLFENHEGSLLSVIITCISALVIIVSVVVFCLETLKSFKSLRHDVNKNFMPALNACERFLNNESAGFLARDRDFGSTNGIPLLNLYSQDVVMQESSVILNECSFQSDLNLKFRYALARCQIEFSGHKKQLREIYTNFLVPSSSQQALQPAASATHQTHRLRHQTKTTESIYLADAGRQDDVFMTLYTVCAEMEKQPSTSPNRWFVLEAYMGSPAGILFLTETCCIVWFVLELTLRFFCCPDKKKFVKSFLNIIDFVAIVPYFVTLLVNTVDSGKHRPPQTATILRIIRLVRMLRILKLSRYSRGFRILGLTLVRSTRVLFLLVCFQVVLAILFSSIVYFVEYGTEGSLFVSIPDSFWWALITMTTVGYGDVAPITLWGKLAGACCAIMGILSISFPVPVIVSNFNYLYNLDKDECKLMPEDLMESEDEKDHQKSANVDRFQKNLFQAMRKSASNITDDSSNQQRNAAQLWNIARKHYRKMSMASIDSRLEKSPSKSGIFNVSPAKMKMAAECSGHASRRATSV
ncbi:unnamed protein product [Clavelina lepadiformis]|uniref:Uncharacterized protein n=1 Tax=Clavelina lepadiformis TaxID=159417 RepID=A0ABP0FJZ7_CLALP